MNRSSFYIAESVPQVTRLLSLLDREPHSVSWGSFDRDHWAWKFRDFPLGMMQTAAYPLALLWRHPFANNPCFSNPRVLDWIAAAMEQTLSRQHDNGAFDAFVPNEQAGGTTLGVMHGVAEAFRLVRGDLPAGLQSRFLDCVRRACDFVLRYEDIETHSFVSNHWGLFAVAFLDAHELLGDQEYRARAEAIVARILREQSSEGWYREYDGPDPGYESLGIHHLATYWQRTRSADVLDSLRRSVEFYSHCVHPDGSAGGVYGSRHTSLYFPGGFEILAGEIPLAGKIAQFMRDRLPRQNVLTPSVSDAENLPPMLYSYLEAALVAEAEPRKPLPLLPCESLRGVRYFPQSGIAVAGSPHYYAVVNAAKGGVCRIFDGHTACVAYEDAGYIVRAGNRDWNSQRLGLSQHAAGARPSEITCTASFSECSRLLPTPAKYVLLRLLNLTLFRSPTLGGWFRDRIIAVLITGKRSAPMQLRRKVVFEEDSISFSDCLRLSGPMDVQQVSLPRSYTGIHMGSAKYFHPNELETVPAVPVDGLAAELNRARTAVVEFTLRFRSGGSPELLVGPHASQPEPFPAEVLSRP